MRAAMQPQREASQIEMAEEPDLDKPHSRNRLIIGVFAFVARNAPSIPQVWPDLAGVE